MLKVRYFCSLFVLFDWAISSKRLGHQAVPGVVFSRRASDAARRVVSTQRAGHSARTLPRASRRPVGSDVAQPGARAAHARATVRPLRRPVPRVRRTGPSSVCGP